MQNGNAKDDSQKQIMKLKLAGEESAQGKFNFKSVEGILWKLASLLFFAIMQIVLKQTYLTSNITPMEVIYWRGLALISFNYIFARYCGVNVFLLPREQWGPMFYRSCTGICGVGLFFTSAKLFPLSLVSALSYLAPMMTAFLCYFFLHETLTFYDIGGMVIAFVGVLAIIFNPYKSAESEHYTAKSYWFIIPLLNPLFGAISTILIRHMGKTIHYTMSPAYFGLFSSCALPMIAFAILSIRGSVTVYSWMLTFELFVMGIMAWLGQITMTRSLQIEKAGRVQAFNYFNVVIMLCADFLLFDIAIHWLDILGIITIIGSNIAITILKGCKFVD